MAAIIKGLDTNFSASGIKDNKMLVIYIQQDGRIRECDKGYRRASQVKMRNVQFYMSQRKENSQKYRVVNSFIYCRNVKKNKY